MIEARRCAEELLGWCMNSDNTDALSNFTKKLTDSLEKVIKAASAKSFTINFEKMWKGLFLLQSKPEFRSQWAAF